MSRLGFLVRSAQLYLSGNLNNCLDYAHDYDMISRFYDRKWVAETGAYSADMLGHIRLKSGHSMLDLGCGTGFMAGTALSVCKKLKVTCVDGSDGMLKVARKNLRRKDIKFIKADLLGFLRSCPSGSFDVVTSGWSLPYVNPAHAIREISRVLKPGGQVAIITNRRGCVETAVRSIVRIMQRHPDKLARVDRIHLNLVRDSASLGRLLLERGINPAYYRDGEHSLAFPDGAAASAWLRQCGSVAGASRLFTSLDFSNELAAELDKAADASGKIVITHKFSAVTGEKK